MGRAPVPDNRTEEDPSVPCQGQPYIIPARISQMFSPGSKLHWPCCSWDLSQEACPTCSAGHDPLDDFGLDLINLNFSLYDRLSCLDPSHGIEVNIVGLLSTMMKCGVLGPVLFGQPKGAMVNAWQLAPWNKQTNLVCSVCWFLWCKYSHYGWFQAINVLSWRAEWERASTVAYNSIQYFLYIVKINMNTSKVCLLPLFLT